MSNHHPASPAAMIGFLLQHREMLWDLVKRDFVGRYKGPMLRHKGRRWSRKTQCTLRANQQPAQERNLLEAQLQASEADRTSLYAHKLFKIGLKAGIIRAKKA